MITKLNSLLLCLCLTLMTASLAFAGDNDSKSKSEVRTITGCLTQGDTANEFVLTGRDGSNWEVRGEGVDLSSHVGQTISAKGAVSHAKMHNLKEDAKDTATDTGMKKDNNESGHMKITDVKVVSRSCK